MIKAVIYARYSSASQREESIEAQIRVCSEYAKRNDMVVVGEYIDRAMTGTNDNRPDFQRMIADLSKKSFQAVIVYSVDRFSRDRYDAAFYKRKIKQAGVTLHYASTDIPNTPEGIILESVMEGLAEYYSVELSNKINRGLMQNVLNGKTASNTPAYGYKRIDGVYKADPTTAPIVREIFERYRDGDSITDIVNSLNARGLRGVKGKPFNRSSFHHMLTNRRYLGEYVYKGVKVENGCEQIISQELFDAVQIQMKKVKVAKSHHKAKELFLLQGKVFCGKCDAVLTSDTGTGKHGEVHRYYKCYARKYEHTCDKKTEVKDELEKTVVRLTVQHVLTDENIESIATKVHELMAEDRRRNEALAVLEHQIADNKKALNNMTKAIEMGVITTTTINRLKELEDRQNDLAAEYERKKACLPPVLTKEQVVFWLESFRNGDIESEKYRAKIINTLVNKVYVYDNDDGGRTLKLLFNMSTNNLAEMTEAGSTIGETSPPLAAKLNPTWLYPSPWVVGLVIQG